MPLYNEDMSAALNAPESAGPSIDHAKDTRYQVIATGRPIHNFGARQRAEAIALKDEWVAAGVKNVSFWDCYNNPLSDLLTLSPKPARSRRR